MSEEDPPTDDRDDRETANNLRDRLDRTTGDAEQDADDALSERQREHINVITSDLSSEAQHRVAEARERERERTPDRGPTPSPNELTSSERALLDELTGGHTGADFDPVAPLTDDGRNEEDRR